MKATIFFSVLFICMLSGCEKKSQSQMRAERLAATNGNILVAVAWPLDSPERTLIDGITLAVDEVNAGGGILGGRKVALLIKDDAASLSTGRLVAQEIADNTDVAAVIGHLNSYVAAPAALIYDRAGLVMITPGASSQKITARGGRLVFRSLPGNRDQGVQIAEYAATQKYKNVAIYYVKNDYGIDLANHFEQHAHELGIVVADRRSYDMGGDDHGVVLKNWAMYLKMDAIFLVGSLPESAQIMREIRALGIRTPVFGGAGLDSPQLISAGGPSVEGTVVFSLFNLDAADPTVLAFKRKFRAKFGVEPDSSAAQGYDTLHLLTQAIAAAHSTVPQAVAQALRATSNWRGVTGIYNFDVRGDVVGRQLAKTVVQDGKFVFFDGTPPRVYEGPATGLVHGKRCSISNVWLKQCLSQKALLGSAPSAEHTRGAVPPIR